MEDLNSYGPRYDPTVIPIAEEDKTSSKPPLPAPTKRRGPDNGYYTSADYHALYLSKKLTPTAVVEGLLPLIRRDADPPGKHSVAFMESKIDIIRSSAEASTARYNNGNPLSPIDGVPVAIKDQVDVEGYKLKMGSKLELAQSGKTAWCVKQWEQAGAIVIGTTSMHELGLGKANTLAP